MRHFLARDAPVLRRVATFGIVMADPIPPETENTDPVTGHRAAARARPPRRSGARVLLVVMVFGVLTLGAGIAGTVWLAVGDMGGDVTENSFLEVDLTGHITDAPQQGGFVMDPADFPPVLTEMTADIRRAATDERIKGMYVELSGGVGGWAATQEMRDAILAFKESGKPCYAWSEGYDNKGYYLATACGEVYLAPAGMMVVNGFSVTTEYYLGTFEKLGVHADFEHVGDFKTAVEPLQRSEPSEAAALAMDQMLDSLFAQFLDGIAKGRKITVEEAKTLVDQAPVTPQQALDAKMVDGLKFRDEVRDGMAGKERTKIGDYHENPAPFASGKKIAIVHAEGEIIDGESGSSLFGSEKLGDQTFEEQLSDIRDDADIVAVVLRVNSPGGSGLASDNMWHQIDLTKAAGKPVVVSMGDYAASGGYYISAGADKIYAEPGTLTGSIGVFGGKINMAGLYEKVGVTLHTWKRGELSGLLDTQTDFNDVERARFRDFLSSFYDQFLMRVAAGRNMEKAAVHEVAQGRVWTGEQAKERGLVDAIGGLDQAIASARELAKVGAEEEVRLDRYPKRKTFVEQVMEDLSKSSSADTPNVSAVMISGISPDLARSIDRLELLQEVLGTGGVAALMPETIEVK